MLLEEEDRLVGKLIALLNGLNEVEDSKEIEDFTRSSLLAILENHPLNALISAADQLKIKYLYHCLSCKIKCGRTEDFSINSIYPIQIRDSKIKSYEQFKKKYTDKMSFKDIVYSLTSLSW